MRNQRQHTRRRLKAMSAQSGKGGRRRGALALLCLLLCACIAISAACAGCTPQVVASPADQGQVLSMLFVNVGKADAALLRLEGKNYLIDTGTQDSTPQLLHALAASGVDSLAGVFLTHTHSDHIGGLEAVAAQYAIDTLYSGSISENKKNGDNKIDLLAQQLSLDQAKLSAGDTVALSDGVALQVLGPLVYNAEDDNDNSLVLRLYVNGKTLLFAGDMQFAEEQTLLDAGVDVSADVLKVGNHGNPDATSEAFAAAVSPQVAILSTDTQEDTDSAAPRVLQALGAAKTYCTQDYALGILLTIDQSGSLQVSDLQA